MGVLLKVVKRFQWHGLLKEQMCISQQGYRYSPAIHLSRQAVEVALYPQGVTACKSKPVIRRKAVEGLDLAG